MIGASPSIVSDRPQLSFLDRVAAWLATGLSIFVLFELGWHVCRPNDPLAAVSFLSRGAGGLSSFIAAMSGGLLVAVLVFGCAAIGTLIAGRRLADVGAFAAAAGLAGLSVRGDTAEYFLLSGGKAPTESARGLALLFMLEALIWLVIALGAVAICGVLTARFGGSAGTDEATRRKGPPPLIPALLDAPRVGEWMRQVPMTRTPVDLGVKHAAIVLAGSLFAFMLLSIGSSNRVIQHGQALFTATAAVCIGCYIAFHVAPVRSALWSILGAGLFVLLAYLWAAIRPPTGALPPSVPASPFLRVLPIQFVASSMAAAIAMSWYMYISPEPEAPVSPRPRASSKR